MKLRHYCMIFLPLLFTSACDSPKTEKPEAPFVWEGANLYFLLTDRFNNGNPDNEVFFDRNRPTGKLRGFEGGDLRGVIQKIDEGYFTDLGINAIWLTPLVEQIHDAIDEGTGATYGFHGYWAKDWTRLDPNFGTETDLRELVEKAHAKGIRIVLDGVINHTGPVTEKDPVWPDDWVRTDTQCTYDNFEHTVSCTLVKNLPDILTESNENVALPEVLVAKWKAEGRYEQEMKELDAFFERTGYPRAPRFYIIKWLTDYILDFGVDGYRADTVKHTEEYVWKEFRDQCDYAFQTWKTNNPDKVLDDNPFFTVGEVYGYNIAGGQWYDYGDRKVNYFENGFNALINFGMKYDSNESYEQLFSKYSEWLNNALKDFTTVNYLTSHDDGQPFDQARKRTFETATKLLLTPGISQVYYGDESARPLIIEGTEGDATLRSKMNWDDIARNPETKILLSHWQKLGVFRKNHPAVGAGIHQMISASPYVFSRVYVKNNFTDKVVVGLDLPTGKKTLSVGTIFADGTKLRDAYSGETVEVKNGNISIDTAYELVLLEENGVF
ncbi:MAG: alpha-amlyase [Bacteroidetes bacterium HGW-Bacteroidetes-13]|nr:MAG: alpha-amlyase [Bacteroidetes bacterium HGW-Bacteroidetes-13]